MKIIQLIYALSSGGAERFTVDLSNELSSLGHDVHIVVFRDDEKSHFYDQFIAENVTYHNMQIKEGFRLSYIFKVRSFLLDLKPDIIHCHLNVIPYVFSLALFNRDIKIYHTLHSVAGKTIGSRYQKRLNHFFYRTNKIRPITISKECDISYKKIYHLENSVIISNGRSPVSATGEFSEVKSEIERLKANEETPVFLHVARFSSPKNQQLLIDSFNRIALENKNFLLLIIGRGFESGEGMELRKRSCSSIRFLGEKHNVNDYFLCSDAFCLTSLWEGLPITLLEALSAGCVPICTPAGGVVDVIKDSITGYITEDFSEGSYVACIQRYLTNRTLIKANDLKSYFEMNYSIRKNAMEHIERYTNALNKQ